MVEEKYVPMSIDLDKSRAARNEAKGDGPVVTMGGEKFQLTPEMPYAFVEALRDLRAAQSKDDGLEASNVLARVVRAMLADDYDRFMATNPSIQDVTAMIEGVAPAYGMTVGESPASES